MSKVRIHYRHSKRGYEPDPTDMKNPLVKKRKWLVYEWDEANLWVAHLCDGEWIYCVYSEWDTSTLRDIMTCPNCNRRPPKWATSLVRLSNL